MNDFILPSKLQVMRALFLKDVRFFRVPTIALLMVGIGCYSMALVAMFLLHIDARPPQLFYAASVVAINLTALLASAFGGIAIAGERTDRSSDFTGMLPITRTQIILSKCLASLFILGAWASVHAIIALSILTTPTMQMLSYLPESFGVCAAYGVGVALSFFGVAWLFGTFAKSGPISACASIAITLSFASLSALCIDSVTKNARATPLGVGSVTFAVGLTSLIVGIVYYAKRVAP